MRLHSNQLIEELTQLAGLFTTEVDSEVPDVPTSLTSRPTPTQIRSALRLVDRVQESRQAKLPPTVDELEIRKAG